MSTIYVDMDDVLCETARGFLALLRRTHDRRVAYEEIVSFDLARSFGLTREEIDRFMDQAHREEVLIGLAPIRGSIETLVAWEQDGYCLDVVTGRPPSSETVSRAWLDRHQVPYDRLTFLAKYSHSLSTAGERRSKSLSELSPNDYCLAIEDSREMAVYLAEELALDVVLLDRPWNRDGSGPLPEKVVRCRDWQELRRRFSRP